MKTYLLTMALKSLVTGLITILSTVTFGTTLSIVGLI